MNVLIVAYSLAVMRSDTAGGAEQIALALDRELSKAGHRTMVVAQRGSATHGRLLETPAVGRPIDDAARRRAQEAHARAITAALGSWRFDIVHMHGLDFDAYLPPPGVAVLSTLHLPATWYTPAALAPQRPDTWIHAVSAAQHRDVPPGPHVLDPIPNGIVAGRPPAGCRRRPGGVALYLGRICPEKGVHLAIAAAARAPIPLVIAGAVQPYPEHEAYFEQHVAPQLSCRARFVGQVGRIAKARWLSRARCLLVPSLVPETSSLVAMEAMSRGVPVIAFRRGALPEIVEDGVTGFLVDDVEQMAAAIARTDEISADECRRRARDRFTVTSMVRRYVDVYQRLLAWRTRVASTVTSSAA